MEGRGEGGGCGSSNCITVFSLLLNIVLAMSLLALGLVLVVNSEPVFDHLSHLNSELLQLEEIDSTTFEDINEAIELLNEQDLFIAIALIVWASVGIVVYVVHFYGLLKERPSFMSLSLIYMLFTTVIVFGLLMAAAILVVINGGQLISAIGLISTVVLALIFLALWLLMHHRKRVITASHKWVLTEQ